MPPGEESDATGEDADALRRQRIRRRQFLALGGGAVLAGVGALVAVEEASGPPKAPPPPPLPPPPPTPHGEVSLDTYYDSSAYRSKTAAIQAAYEAAAKKNATLQCRAGRVYSLDAGPLQLRPDTPITIQGNGATFQANWGNLRCIDLDRTADYQTFRDIEIQDLIFDANHHTSSSQESVVGNLISGGGIHSQRVDVTRITLSRCRWINVPYGTTASYSCFAVQSLHRSPGERQTRLTEIRLEQCRMRGGNIGARVIGAHLGGHVAVEVYHDQIYLDIDHDTGVVPTARVRVSSGNAHIGSLGFGNYCEVRLTGANSADVGVEIDGMQTAVVYGQVTDARNAAFFARNFHAPPDPSTQEIRFVKCKSEVIRLDPDGHTYSARGFFVGDSTPPNPTFNRAILEDCSFYSAASNFASTAQAMYVPPHAMVNRVSVVGDFNVVCNRVDDQPTVASRPSLVGLFPAQSRFLFDIPGRLVATVAGRGGANLMPLLVWISPQNGCRLQLAINRIELSSSLAGVAPGATHGVVLGRTQRAAGSISGYIHYLGWGAFSGGDTNPSLLYVSSSTPVSLGKLVVGTLDLSKSPSKSPTRVRGNAAESAKIQIQHVMVPSGSTSGGG